MAATAQLEPPPHLSARRVSAVVPLRLLSDEQLTRLVAGGDRRAFAAIYERHHQGLYRYCCSILRSPDDAHDVLQSTWLAALRTLEGERREISLKAWLYRVAHNESISMARRRRPQDEIDAAADIPAAEQPETRDTLRQLISDLHALPERQRTAIVLRELSGLTYEEIGASLEISAAAATQTVYAARKGLHELVDGRELECDAVQRSISMNDRRVMRARKLQAHLRACGACREFEVALGRRSAQLAMLAPPLPAMAAAELLRGVLSTGAASGTAAIGAAGTGAGTILGASAVIKGLVVTAALAVGTGASLAAIDADKAAPVPRGPAAVAGPVHTVATKSSPGTTRPQPDPRPGAKPPSRDARRTADAKEQEALPGQGASEARAAVPGSGQQAPAEPLARPTAGEPKDAKPTETSSAPTGATTQSPYPSGTTQEQPPTPDATYPTGGATQQPIPIPTTSPSTGSQTQQAPAPTYPAPASPTTAQPSAQQ